MRDVPEMRPIAIANRESGETELKAAMWDEEIRAWVTSDERVFEGPKPDESDGLIIAEQIPDTGLMSNVKDKISNIHAGKAELGKEKTKYVSESQARDQDKE